MYIYIYIFIYIYICTYICASSSGCLHIHFYIHVYMFASLCVCLVVYLSIYTYICIYIYPLGSKENQKKFGVYHRKTDRRALFSNSSQQTQDVEALLEEAREAHDAGDGLGMYKLSSKVLLGLPRFKPRMATGHRMTVEAKEQLKAALQTKIRAAILMCLRGLDLEDAGTWQRSDVQVSLGRIKVLMEGVDLNLVKSRKQWSAIGAFIANYERQKASGDHSNTGPEEIVVSWLCASFARSMC